MAEPSPAAAKVYQQPVCPSPLFRLAVAIGGAAKCIEIYRPVDIGEELVEHGLAANLISAATTLEIAVEQICQAAALGDERLQPLCSLVLLANSI